jgi:hypothetical protein
MSFVDNVITVLGLKRPEQQQEFANPELLGQE